MKNILHLDVIFRIQILFVLLTAWTSWGQGTNAEPPRSRVPIAIFPFHVENDPANQSPYRFVSSFIVQEKLTAVKSIRVLPSRGGEYAYGTLNKRAGDLLDEAEARRAGEMLGAGRVLFGECKEVDGKWAVSVHLLNVGQGSASRTKAFSGTNWLEMTDAILEMVVQELKVTLTEEERTALARTICSSAAFKDLLLAYAKLQESGSIQEILAQAQKAAQLDPDSIYNKCMLGLSFANANKLEEAESVLREVLAKDPKSARACRLLGQIFLIQQKFDDGAIWLRQAKALDPDDADVVLLLSMFYRHEGLKSRCLAEMKAARELNPYSATIGAQLASAFIQTGEKTNAELALKDAERVCMGKLNEEYALANAYDELNDIPQFLEHAKKCVIRAEKEGVRSQAQLDELKTLITKRSAALTPTNVICTLPAKYAKQAKFQLLAEKLKTNELALVVDPLASSPDIKHWAEQITAGGTNDFQKGRMIFDVLKGRLNAGDVGILTAQEAFSAWNSNQVSFRCQDLARLYVAMARDVGLESYYVTVDKDAFGKQVLHACAAFVSEGKVFLVDPTYNWFGPAHQVFHINDDVEAISLYLCQLKKLPQHQISIKLAPHLQVLYYNYIGTLIDAKQIEEARKLLPKLVESDPKAWLAFAGRGAVEAMSGKFEEAIALFENASKLNPEVSQVHFNRAQCLGVLEKWKEARDEYRLVLKCPDADRYKTESEKAIAEISGKIGYE